MRNISIFSRFLIIVAFTVCESTAYALNCASPTDLFVEDFTFTYTGFTDLHAYSLKKIRNGKIETTYRQLDPNGAYFVRIEDDQCMVVDDLDAGANWGGKKLSGTTGNKHDETLPSGGYVPQTVHYHDGYLIINCNQDPGKIFGFTIDGLCPNTTCHFSANICSLIATKDNAAPGKVRFTVKGKQTGRNYIDQTHDIPNFSGGNPVWKNYSVEFDTGNDTEYTFELYNAYTDASLYPKADGSPGVNGNDIAIDDIKFTACVPSIDLFSDPQLSKKDILLNCATTTTLYVNTNEIKQYFPTTAYYLVQSSTDQNVWTNEGGVTQNTSFPISISKTDTQGKYFRIWVGGSEQNVINSAQSGKVTDCSQLTAVSSPVKVTYTCPCTPSNDPTPKNYSECPVTTGNGTIDLSTLVTKSYTGTYTWYESQTTATALSNTMVDAKTVQTKTYYVSYTENAGNYCESNRVPVTVKVKDAVKFNITPSDITTCLFQGADLTYTVSNKIPSSATITWRNGTTDLGTGDSYTLPAQPGTGTITAVASDPAKTACECSQSVTYNLTPVNKFTLSASPAFVCTGNPVSTITATIIDGTGDYTLFKDGTPVKSGTVTPTNKTISYTDSQVGTSAGKVTYSMVFGAGNCKDEQSTTVDVGAEFEIPVKSDAANNRVCVGDEFSLTAEYTLKAGESLIWKQDGNVIPGSDVTISGLSITNDANFTVELVGGSCAGTGSINMNADFPAKPSISASTYTVCEGYSFDLMDSDPVTATSYQWQMQTNGGAWTDMAKETSKNVTGYTPVSTASYRLTAKNGLCSSVSNVVEVAVTPPPSILSITDASVCLSNPVATLVAEIDNDNIPYVWSKNGATFDSGTIPTGASKITLTDNNVAASIGTVKYSLTIGSGSCSDTKDTKVEVSNKTSITLMSDAANDRVCAGDPFSVTALYTLQTGESLEWAKDGVTLAETGVKLENETIDKNTLYTVTLNGGLCSGDGSLQMYADTPPVPVIDASEKNICKGSVIDLTDSDPSAVTKYVWEINTGAGYKVMEGKNTKDIMAYVPDETASYRLTAINGVCTRLSNEVSVTVNPPIEFSVTPNQSICQGGSASLSMSGYPASAKVAWYQGSTLLTESESLSVTPNVTTIYTAKVVDVCTASKNSTVNVEPAIVVTISPDSEICYGESAKLTVTGGKSYSWTPAASLSDPTSATTLASPKETTKYTVTVTTDLCSTTASTTVKVNPLPVIVSVTETDPGEATAVVEKGTEPYLYSLNNKDFDASAVITGIPIGHHVMYVIDNAGCKAQAAFEIEPVPIIPDKFFTPNEDGTNETWKIKGLSSYSSYIVEIFDRYGKRVYVFYKGGYSKDNNTDDFTGWDGIYNGHPMPATDYWYLITVEEIRQQFNGHFTLKR